MGRQLGRQVQANDSAGQRVGTREEYAAVVVRARRRCRHCCRRHRRHRRQRRRPAAVQRPRATAVQPVDAGLGHQQLVDVGRRRHQRLGGGGDRGGRRRTVVVITVVAAVLVHGIHQATDDLGQPHLASSVIVATAHYIFLCSTRAIRAGKKNDFVDMLL